MSGASTPQQCAPAFHAPGYDFAEARSIADELGLADPVAITLVRRGHRTVEQARAFLAADETYDPALFEGIDDAVEAISDAIVDGARITVHGDYDVDGICSTAIMVAALRGLGAECDWLIPDRLSDGYGLGPAVAGELRERGTGLLVTVDCGIGSVAEVVAIREAGIDVVISDHHQPGPVLPECPIVHPIVSGYPFEGLCGAAVAAKLAQATIREAGGDDVLPDPDLVALATVADLVPLVGENRYLVRSGLQEIRRSPRPGLSALMAASKVEAEHVDEGDVAFRLGPRLNAAGRLYRADAGVELMLTDDRDRAASIAAELDAANQERRETERAVANEAEAALRALPEEERSAPVIVVAGQGWHPGVVGIVASRLVERHERPAIVLSIGEDGNAKGSCRSIAGFDILAALESVSGLLIRYGGHRAAAGLELPAGEIDRFRAAIAEHAAAVVPPEGLGEPTAIDAFVGAEALDLEVAEQLSALAPFGQGNPGIRLLVPGARIGDIRPMGDDGKHARFRLSTGSLSASGVAFNANGKLAAAEREPHDIAVRLEVNHWNGAIEPRAVLDDAFARMPSAADAVHGCDENAAADWWDRFGAELGRDPTVAATSESGCEESRSLLDVRPGSGIARISELLSSGERVLVLTADGARRSALAAPGVVTGSVGGSTVCMRCSRAALGAAARVTESNLLVTDWASAARSPMVLAGFEHVVAVDPPADRSLDAVAGGGAGYLHVCWSPGAGLAESCWDAEWDLRPALADVFRGLAGGEASGDALRTLLTGPGAYGRSAEAGARAIRVLVELGLVETGGDADSSFVRVVSSERTELERSGAFRAYSTTHQEGREFLQSRRAEP